MSDRKLKSLSYESPNQSSISYCAFSQCGQYFGFVENRNVVHIYEVPNILSSSNADQTNNSYCETTWHSNGIPVNLLPLITLDITGDADVNCIVFGDGKINKCRLPHRLSKRRSQVTKYPDQTCVIAVAKSDGYVDVYNLNLLRNHVSPIMAKMVLFDGRRSIIHLGMSSDGSLRLASTNCLGMVKLWDIWDDGNMYATLTSPMGRTSFVYGDDLRMSKHNSIPYNHEIAVTTWHPFKGHLFLGDRRGHGLVLEDECPYTCQHVLRHYHRISEAVYSRDGDFLLTSSYDGSCTLWSVPSYLSIYTYWHLTMARNISLLGGANDFHITSLALSPDSESFATFCEDGYLRLWPLSCSRDPRILTYRDDLDRRALHKRKLVFSPCGSLLACALGDKKLQLWILPSFRHDSLLHLCVASIRQRVVSKLFGDIPTASAETKKEKQEVLTALAALPLPRSLRCLLCHHLDSMCA